MISIQSLVDEAKCYSVTRELRWPDGSTTCTGCGSVDIKKDDHGPSKGHGQHYFCHGHPEAVKNLGRKGRRNRLRGARGTLEKEKPPILGMIPTPPSNYELRCHAEPLVLRWLL